MAEENKAIQYHYRSLLSSKEIAELTGLSLSNLSNKKKKDDFPERRDDSKTPLYYYGDIVKWAYTHGIPVDGKKVSFYDLEALSKEAAETSMNICLCGRSKSGKSFTASYFLEDEIYMRKGLCGSGIDFTQIPVRIVIDGSYPTFQFSADEDFVKSVEDKFKDGYEDWLRKIKPYSNRRIYIDRNAPDYPEAMESISSWIGELREKGLDPDKHMSIEIYGKPSALSRHIMNRCHKEMLVVTDMPGTSSGYRFSSIGHYDTVIYVLRDESLHDFKKALKELSEVVGANSVIYLYHCPESAADEKEYLLAKQAGEKVISKYVGAINDEYSKDSVISRSIGALCPLKNFVVIPALKSQRITDADRSFIEELEEALVNSTGNKVTRHMLSEALKGQDREKVLDFLKELIRFPEIEKNDYDGDIVKDWENGNVIIEINKLVEVLDELSVKALNGNRENLERFKIKDCNEWQRMIIRYVYQVIEQSFRKYPSLGRKTGPDAESPLLLIMESIFADWLVENLIEEDGKYILPIEEEVEVTKKYRNALKEKCIALYRFSEEELSDIIANPYMLYNLKLQIESGLMGLPCTTEEELVQNRIVDSLFFVAVNAIYRDVLRAMGETDNKEIAELIKKTYLEESKKDDI